jgi:protein-disulfide isomerase
MLKFILLILLILYSIGGKEMNRFLPLVLIICFISVGFLSCDSGDLTRDDINQLIETQKEMLTELKEIKEAMKKNPSRAGQQVPRNLVLSVDKMMMKGNPNAPVTLIEFSDYQCPFCARHSKNTYPQIVKEYIDTGKVKLVFVDYPLDFHNLAPKASEASHCAGDQGKYWEMHDILFENSKALQPENLPRYAEQAGVKDINSFNKCLESGKYSEMSKSGSSLAAKAGVRGTPGFLLGYSTTNNKDIKIVKSIKGARPYESFKTDIDDMLNNSK